MLPNKWQLTAIQARWFYILKRLPDCRHRISKDGRLHRWIITLLSATSVWRWTRALAKDRRDRTRKTGNGFQVQVHGTHLQICWKMGLSAFPGKIKNPWKSGSIKQLANLSNLLRTILLKNDKVAGHRKW